MKTDTFNPESPRVDDASASTIAQRLVEAYATLKRVARRERRAAQSPATLSTTALVHEAYLRVAGQGQVAVESEAHLLALCAKTMRHVLVDYSRARHALKRNAPVIELDLAPEVAEQRDPAAILALDQALHEIEAHDPRLARVIEYRVFAGLEPAEIALALGVDLRTVQRDWLRAYAWLKDALP